MGGIFILLSAATVSYFSLTACDVLLYLAETAEASELSLSDELWLPDLSPVLADLLAPRLVELLSSDSESRSSSLGGDVVDEDLTGGDVVDEDLTGDVVDEDLTGGDVVDEVLPGGDAVDEVVLPGGDAVDEVVLPVGSGEEVMSWAGGKSSVSELELSVLYV